MLGLAGLLVSASPVRAGEVRKPPPHALRVASAAAEGEGAPADAKGPPPDVTADPSPDLPADLPAVSGPGLSSRPHYRRLIEKEAAHTGLAPEIAEAVMEVESGFNPAAVGSSGEIGLMQVMPSTARMMGLVGPISELERPETNIHYGVTYLSQAWSLAGGDLCTAVMKYRAGHGETRFSTLSVNYCLAVRAKLLARGFPVTGVVPRADFASALPPRFGLGGALGCRRRCIGGAGRGWVDLAALNAKLSTLVVQVKGLR